MDKRRLQVDVERQMAKVEEARKLTSEAMQQLQQPAFTREQIQQAENGVKLIGTVLAKGTALIEKDNRYSFYDGEVKKRAAEVTEKIAAKKVVLAAREAKAVLVDGTAAAKAKIKVARAPEGKDSDVNAAVQAVEAIGKALEAQAALEKQNPAYAAQAEKTRNELFVITDKLEFAKLARDLRKKTSEMLAAGVAAVAAGQADKNLRGRKGQYEKALGLFRSCQSDGAQLTEGLPALAKLPVLVEGRPMSPREVMALCEQRAGEADQLMKGVAPLIKFEDGPKKSYEAGKALLEKGKKTEALAQYNECVATGIILQHDQPAMTDTKYEVAGTQLTLGEIIKQCVAQRKALMGK